GAACTVVSVTGRHACTASDRPRLPGRLDSQPFGEFSGARSVTLRDLPGGAHTFEVVARDRAGNVDPTAATKSFTVSVSRIALAEPEPGATLPAGLQLVRGTIATGGQEIVVTINGIAAAV